MTPIDAALREITLEMEALRNRIGNGPMPESVAVEIVFDRVTGMPRTVDLQEHRRRPIRGAEIDQRRRIA